MTGRIARLREWAARELARGVDLPWASLERERILTRAQAILWAVDYLEGKTK